MSLLLPLALPVVVLAFSGSAEQTQGVFRDAVLEITMPPGVPVPTATKAPDTDMPGDTEKLFAAILGAIKGNFRVESQSRFTHQGHPGMRLTLSSTALNQVQRMDCFLVNQRLVRVWFIARTLPDLEAPAVRAFFDSLRIK
jgi:hypothetical protein